ncbi:MAG: FtsX-like permease family protein, partial [Betaproteobacteria bacterium]
IASVLVVSVVQKSREIGILRAMGASRRAILGVFLLQGAILGALGAGLGALGGLALARAFARVFRNPDGTVLFRPEVTVELVAGTAAVALAVGVLAAAIPARRAASLDPVEAIRHG